MNSAGDSGEPSPEALPVTHMDAAVAQLREAWEEVSGKPVSEFMKSWTEQMGFPVLRVTEDGSDKMKVEQRWFLSDGGAEARTW